MRASSVFVRTGSRNESAQLNGISHVVEHMAFKGTAGRDAHRINLDAERLGAQVNAHTDKDHTAYHISGLAQHAGRFVRMLGEIVRGSTFPADELERERQVILQEYLEDDDDAVSTAFKLFDTLCFGRHPLGQPVIGTKRNIERFTRDELLAYVAHQYTGANVIVGVAGDIDPQAIVADVEAAFGSMPAGEVNTIAAPSYVGGTKLRRQAGSSQSHVVIGYPIAPLQGAHDAPIVAAALFGEGMSSPLMHEIREKRGLVYYASCSAEVADGWGLFTVEASTMPEHLGEFFDAVGRLLLDHTGRPDRIGLERARNQILVRRLQARERPHRLLEDAAQDLFAFGRVRPAAELADRIAAVTGPQVRGVFEQMLADGASVRRGRPDRPHADRAAGTRAVRRPNSRRLIDHIGGAKPSAAGDRAQRGRLAVAHLGEHHDLRARHQQRCISRLDGHDRHAIGHGDGLGPVLVLQRHRAAARSGGEFGDGRVGHRAAGLQVPLRMAFAGAARCFREHQHLERLQRAVGLRHRGRADEAACLDRRCVDRVHLVHAELVGDREVQRLAAALGQHQRRAVERLDRAAQALRRGRCLCDRDGADEREAGSEEVFHAENSRAKD